MAITREHEAFNPELAIHALREIYIDRGDDIPEDMQKNINAAALRLADMMSMMEETRLEAEALMLYSKLCADRSRLKQLAGATDSLKFEIRTDDESEREKDRERIMDALMALSDREGLDNFMKWCPSSSL